MSHKPPNPAWEIDNMTDKSEATKAREAARIKELNKAFSLTLSIDGSLKDAAITAGTYEENFFDLGLAEHIVDFRRDLRKLIKDFDANITSSIVHEIDTFTEE